MSENKESAIDQNSQLKIDRLDAALTEFEKKKNIVSDIEFSKYAALFQVASRKNMDLGDITDLSSQFIKRFNTYEDITVVDYHGKTLFTVPRLFIPIKDISSEYTTFVNRFHKDVGSDIPKYAAEATGGFIAAIVKSQHDATDGDYAEHIKRLAIDYANKAGSVQRAKSIGDDELPDDEVDDRDRLSESRHKESISSEDVGDMKDMGLAWD